MLAELHLTLVDVRLNREYTLVECEIK